MWANHIAAKPEETLVFVQGARPECRDRAAERPSYGSSGGTGAVSSMRASGERRVSPATARRTAQQSGAAEEDQRARWARCPHHDTGERVSRRGRGLAIKNENYNNHVKTTTTMQPQP